MLPLYRPHAGLAEALRQFLYHAHSPGCPAHIVKQHPVRDRRPTVAVGPHHADGKVSKPLGTPFQQFLCKSAKALYRAWMHQAALDQLVRKLRSVLFQRAVASVTRINAKHTGGNVYLPQPFGSLVQGSLQAADLRFLELLCLLEPGNIHPCDQQDRIRRIVFNSHGPDMPPSPSSRSFCRRDPVRMLHHFSTREAIPKRLLQRNQIIRVNQLGQRLGQWISFVIRPDQAAKAGADIDHPGMVPHLQQCHAAAQVFQQTAERDGTHRAEPTNAFLRGRISVFKIKPMFSRFFRLI